MKSTASLKAGLISILKSSASPNKNTGEDTKIASLKKVYSSKSDIVEIIKREKIRQYHQNVTLISYA